MILEMVAIPSFEDLYTALIAHRYSMVGGSEFVWLCCTDEHGWYITAERVRLLGIYARCTIGKGDSNAWIEGVARDLIRKIAESRREAAEVRA